MEKYREFNFRDFDNSFYQFQIGLFDKEVWRAYRRMIKKLLSSDDGYLKMWKNSKESFSSSFQIEIDKIIKEIDL